MPIWPAKRTGPGSARSITTRIPARAGTTWGCSFRRSTGGRGYAAEALALLEYQAFEVDGIHMLHNDFETGRAAACRAHLSAGFSEYRRENGLIELLLTREQYFTRQS